MYEPIELERGHFTDKDQEIRITDLPEQFLQRTYPVVARESAELEQEAKWIYQQAFVTRTISKQVTINVYVCVHIDSCISVYLSIHGCFLTMLLYCIQTAKLFQQ